jgi:para-aminobenzoate synthetase component 1
MRPVICFYQEDQFIFSDNYVLHSCTDESSVTDFLNYFEETFKSDLKIVQVNFEYENQLHFSQQQSLYPCAKASVFVLNKYEILSGRQLLSKIPNTLSELKHEFKLLVNEDDFKKKIESIKHSIREGRLYQVNLTAPIRSQTTYTAEKIFKNYYEKFGGHYKALLPLTHTDLISFSPELFLRKQSNKLKTQPIKGSISTETGSEQALLRSEKENAELSMIVDLLRNDLNRIEQKSSAQVKAHRHIMKLGYIQHTYSEIEIETLKSLPEILLCTAPGGSISGCPKLESLQAIAELESYRRQLYTGLHGWWKDANFNLALSIRSFIKHKDELFYHAGCGIVYDSDPQQEWEEFKLKTQQLMKSR